MKKSFHKLKVSEVRPETHDTVSVKVDVPESLVEEFMYKAGQYLTFKQDINGEDVRRSYSLCSSPVDGEWRVAIKKVPGGRFSTFANKHLKAGDELEVMPPQGNFVTDIAANREKHYVFFAAGSGITPVHSLIKTILSQEANSRITLFYGNKTGGSIIFKESLEALKNKNLGRFAIYYFLSRERMDAELFQGRIDADKCKTLLNCFSQLSKADEYFICGPYEMIEAIKDTLAASGIDKEKIHFELFATPEQLKQNGKPQSQQSPIPEADATFSDVTVKVDGLAIDFQLAYDGDSILDAASQKGADLPYSCKGGVCSTCRAKLVEGDVHMTVNYALEEDEIEDGYILTCQSHPTSERVVIDFDQ